MGKQVRKIDVEKMLEYSDDLINCLLNDKKDANLLALNLRESKLYFSQSHAEFNSDQKLLQEYQEKIALSKKKTEEAKSEIAASEELNFLQKELEEELQKERVLRKELSTLITEELNELEQQKDSVEERRQIVKKLKQDELKAEMKLAMYASVTKTIPSLDEDSKISGCIVEKEKEALDYFEYDKSDVTPFDICNSIWEKISPR